MDKIAYEILQEELKKEFEPKQLDLAYVFAILTLHILFGEYVLVTSNIITNNPLPVDDKKFVKLLRVVANMLERLNDAIDAEAADIAKETVKSLKEMMREME